MTGNSHESNKRPRHQAAVMAEYNSNEDSDGEPAAEHGQLNMLTSSWTNSYDWYIDSGASSHVSNQRHLFTHMEPHRQTFSIVNRGTISSTGKGTIQFHTSANRLVQIQDVVYVPQCDTNLLSLGQLSWSGITYHDNGIEMVFQRDNIPIGKALRVGNLYVLNIV